jgi:SAC3 family protein LENG8/THP3
MSNEEQTMVQTTKLIGTSNALEKTYMRLTSYPKPENVRPIEVLKKALAHIKNQFVQNEDFRWANEQLKGVRQDITVQNLRCAFVLDVYETHARLLLEHGDLNEFNQCQTMIRSMTNPRYIEGDEIVEGKGDCRVILHDDTKRCRQAEETADEFLAYRILYDLVQNSWSDLGSALSGYVTDRVFERTNPDGTCHHEVLLVSRTSSSYHALAVVKAVVGHDYHTFFQLYEFAPHLSAYLMDFLVRRVRNAAYERITAAYRPIFSVVRFLELLMFQDLDETRSFLKNSGAVFVSDSNDSSLWVDCKASFAVMKRI